MRLEDWYRTIHNRYPVICGKVYGHHTFSDGTTVITSTLLYCRGGCMKDGTAVTHSGSEYVLGNPSTKPTRTSFK